MEGKEENDGLFKNEEKPLSSAISQRNLDKILVVVQEFESPSTEYYEWLFRLCDQKELDDELLNLLLKCKSLDINNRDGSGETILHALVRNNHHGLVQFLLLNYPKIEIDAKCNNDKTPLLIAAEYGHFELLKFLELKGAQIYCCDIDKNGAIHFAAKQGNLECLKYLIEQKSVEVDLKNKYDDTPLLKAIEFGHDKCCQYLLDKEASVYSVDENGNTSLIISGFSGNLQCVESLISSISDTDHSFINSRNHFGKTALNWASGKGHNGIVICLLHAGADPDIPDVENKTALIWAGSMGHENIVWDLIDAKANVNIIDAERKTALIWAAGKGHENIVRHLIDAKANVNIIDAEGKTALIWAAGKGHESIVRHLIDAKANVNIIDTEGKTALIWAAGMGHVGIVDILINAGANVNIQDSQGGSALTWSSAHGHEHVVNCLLRANVKVDYKNKCGLTALMCAANAGHDRVVKSLINAKANIDFRNNYRQTALNLAAKKGQLSCVIELVTKGKANTDIRDNNGESPLMKATKNEDLDIVRVLLDAGASVMLKNHKYETAFDLAKTKDMKQLFYSKCNHEK